MPRFSQSSAMVGANRAPSRTTVSATACEKELTE